MTANIAARPQPSKLLVLSLAAVLGLTSSARQSQAADALTPLPCNPAKGKWASNDAVGTTTEWTITTGSGQPNGPLFVGLLIQELMKRYQCKRECSVNGDSERCPMDHTLENGWTVVGGTLTSSGTKWTAEVDGLRLYVFCESCD